MLQDTLHFQGAAITQLKDVNHEIFLLLRKCLRKWTVVVERGQSLTVSVDAVSGLDCHQQITVKKEELQLARDLWCSIEN